MNYTELVKTIKELAMKLPAWRFAALLFALMFTVVAGILAWRLPEILAVLK